MSVDKSDENSLQQQQLPMSSTSEAETSPDEFKLSASERTPLVKSSPTAPHGKHHIVYMDPDTLEKKAVVDMAVNFATRTIVKEESALFATLSIPIVSDTSIPHPLSCV
jgi:hypothetical protein